MIHCHTSASNPDLQQKRCVFKLPTLTPVPGIKCAARRFTRSIPTTASAYKVGVRVRTMSKGPAQARNKRTRSHIATPEGQYHTDSHTGSEQSVRCVYIRHRRERASTSATELLQPLEQHTWFTNQQTRMLFGIAQNQSLLLLVGCRYRATRGASRGEWSAVESTSRCLDGLLA